VTPPVPAATVSPPVELHTLLTGWQTDVPHLVTLALELVLGAWYLAAAHRLARRGRRWSGWRTAAFLGGLAVVVVAVQSGLARYGDEVFSVYVVQHLVLMNLAPIGLALGAPMTLALQASGRPTQTRLLRVLHHPVVEFVTNPVVVAAVAYTTMVGYFVSSFYRLSIEHPLLLDAVQLHFLVSGALFWWLVAGLDPSRWRLGYPAKLGILAVGIPVNAILGVALTGVSTSIAPGVNSLSDVQRGGAILWIVGELVATGAMGIVVYQWMRNEERQAVRADRLLDALEASAAGGRAGALRAVGEPEGD